MAQATAEAAVGGGRIKGVSAWLLTVKSVSRGKARIVALLLVAALSGTALYELPILANRAGFDVVTRVETTTPIHGLARSNLWPSSAVLPLLRSHREVDRAWSLAVIYQVDVRDNRTNVSSLATLVGYDDPGFLALTRGTAGVCPSSLAWAVNPRTVVSDSLAASLVLAATDSVRLSWTDPSGRPLSMNSTADGCMPLKRAVFVPLLVGPETNASFVFVPMGPLAAAYAALGESVPLNDLAYPFWFSQNALAGRSVREAMVLLAGFEDRVTPSSGELTIQVPLLVALNNALAWESGYQILLVVIGVPVAYLALLSLYAVVVTESRSFARYRETLDSRSVTYRRAAGSLGILYAFCSFTGSLLAILALQALLAPAAVDTLQGSSLTNAFAFSVAFGFLSFGIALLAVREASRIDPTSRELLLPPVHRIDLVLTAAGIGSFLFLLAAQSGFSAPADSALGAVYGLVSSVSFALLPLAPAFVAFGLSRTLLYSASGQRVTGFFAKRMHRPLPHLALRELSGDLGQARHLALAITVTVAATLLLLSLQAGLQQQTALAIYSETGSMIAVIPNGDPFQGGLSASDYQQAARLPGVASIVAVIQGTGRVAGHDAIIVAFDWSTYRGAVAVPPTYWAKGTIDPSAAQGTAPLILSVAMSRNAAADIGSTLAVVPNPPLGNGASPIALPVSAIARSLPGLFDYGTSVPAIAFLPLSLLPLNLSTVSYSRFLIQPASGSADVAASELSSMFSWKATVLTASAAQAGYVDSSFADITLAFLSEQAWVILGVAVIGVETVVTLQLLARRWVYTNMAYRGMNRRQMLSFLMVQTSYVYLLAYAVGLSTGLVAGFGFTLALMNQIPTAPFFVPSGVNLDGLYLLALPATLMIITAVSHVAFSPRMPRGARANAGEGPA